MFGLKYRSTSDGRVSSVNGGKRVSVDETGVWVDGGISIDTLVEASTDYSIGISIDAFGQALMCGLKVLTKLPRSTLAILAQIWSMRGIFLCLLNVPNLQDLMRIAVDFPCCFWYCWALWEPKFALSISG
ncbi:hypothetical protein F2Q69_00021737 [Brassica cretica]|uniref:Uncharacterized protein n=1 Tax=Brassica cretica TaxID=69181 RepID=A0A8S9QP85_BRACR|nr:hypothetical protein F2Q69_00021737 [Brassica cretica]